MAISNEVNSLLLPLYWNNAGDSLKLTYTVKPDDVIDQFGRTVQEVDPFLLESARNTISEFSRVANITFDYAPSEGVFASLADGAELTFEKGFLDSGALGLAEISILGNKIIDVEMTLNNIYFNPADFLPGANNEGYQVMLHELGHAMGLSHYDDGGSIFGVSLDLNLDGSMMNSTIGDVGPHTAIGGNPLGLQIFDIAALQHLYGANTGYNSGNNVYNFTGQVATTIWDGGGIDLIDYGLEAQNIILDLREGVDYVTQVGAVRVWNAIGANIENGNAGSGADVLQGNDLVNILNAGAGNDTINGNSGNDLINGNQGVDEVNGNAGNDTIRGGKDNDIIQGGKGDDQIFGDIGNDIIYGNLGNDQMYGGTGNDIFVINGNNGADWVFDFQSAGIADVIQIDATVVATTALAVLQTSFSGGNAFIDFGLGNSLTLAGVTSISLDDFSII